MAGRADEFAPNSNLSTLELLETKGYPVKYLGLQYRMAPAIAQWAAQYFYKGLLRNHPSVEEDNRYRQIARSISKDIYGIKGPKGEGSEY